jgi:hypothetical protein
MKKTRGDVFRINITPPSNTFPLIRIFLHEYGIKESGIDVGSKIGAIKGKSKKALSHEIGEEIIKNSKILSAWFKP